MRLCLVVWVLLLVAVLPAHSSLVAYYDFDDDYSGISGYCQNSVPSGVAAGSADISSSNARFGSAGLVLAGGPDYIRVDGINLFPGAASSAFSASAWIKLTSLSSSYTSRVIVRKNSFMLFQLSTLGGSGRNYALSCQLYFSASVSSSVNTANNLFTQANGASWAHVACVYNTTHVCVAHNACTPASAQQISPSADSLYVGATSNSLRGYVDELKFYDHALTEQQLRRLYNAVAANDVPFATVDIELIWFMSIVADGMAGSSLSAAALTTLNVSVNSSDGKLAYSGQAGTELFYSWSVLSSLCGIADISNSTSSQPALALSNVGSFVLGLCATDGELSAYATAQVQVTASTPSIESQTAGPFLDIPLGYVNFPVTVTAGGVPAPTYQWQYLTYENYTAPDNTTVPDNSTTGNTTTVARRSFDFDDFGPEFPLRWHGARAVIEVWNNFEGAVDSVYRINGTAENNNQSIRCLVTNTGGETYSGTYVVRIGAAAASPSANPGSGGGDSSGDDTNIGAIVGGAVGGGVGLVCLLLLLLALVVLVLARRRNGRRQMRKLTQPDYAELAYGDVDNVSLPKRKAEASPPLPRPLADQYEKLEKLLLAENGRIAHAMFVGIASTDSEKVAKAVMRVFEANHRGYQLLERRISDEVEAADEEGTLFRANSIAAKLFGTYVRMTSLPYCWFTLVTSVNSLNDNALEAFGDEQEGASKASRRMRYQIDDEGSGSMSMDVFASGATTMEIDPHKVDEASDTTINSLELWLVAQKLFKCIVDSERIMPTQIKQLMHHIDSEVGARFSAQAQFRALGGFLFLRMVCPALMALQVYGLLDAPPHPVAQRQFILVSKVLQNLANDTLPAKQASLILLARYLSAHLKGVEQSLEEDGSELVEQLRDVLAKLGDDTNV
ncbi:GTPaseactivator protein for Ras-like GTPase [Acanthamoeba castellanii str. Neff]|uniref:GTPaseactivator protein for Ras-like GTPase n=1 Tax=Acanthamoeba castellanii (strain ATCC 30010 / Neff) TaxID=1257118 RepID=L8GDZ0_ACACF|nr:GTPaseactivator protein for Ras-like GTPase [Acanthamoeba castellanii str. Neff]ELR10938.1 GTPaseactivator protein for Ras-like GTPase [Acanthamoeba castellanii str. Neff]